jgi:hypothetical protein
MQYSRFDRHEVFEMSDTSFVLDCIQKIDKWDYENGGHELANMLYGLFDGYLYDKIYTYAHEHLSEEMYDKLELILDKSLKSAAA